MPKVFSRANCIAKYSKIVLTEYFKYGWGGFAIMITMTIKKIDKKKKKRFILCENFKTKQTKTHLKSLDEFNSFVVCLIFNPPSKLLRQMFWKSYRSSLFVFVIFCEVTKTKQKKNMEKKNKQIINNKKWMDLQNRLMGTRCNATMLTWLIGTKHRVQLRLMRPLFVWQLNVTHPILLQPRSACHRKLGLAAGNTNLKWVNTWMAQY